MSVLVKDDLTNQFYLYTKGADNIMLDKISFTKSPQKYKASIIEDLHSYSCEGYRTLVIAMRGVPIQEFIKFENIYQQLQASTSAFKEIELSKLYTKMESRL